MAKNIGDRDRTIRLIAGVLLIFWGITAGNGLAFIGIYLLATAYFRTDPIYSLSGMNSRSSSEAATNSVTDQRQVEERPLEERARQSVE